MMSTSTSCEVYTVYILGRITENSTTDVVQREVFVPVHSLGGVGAGTSGCSFTSTILNRKFDQEETHKPCHFINAQSTVWLS